MELKPLLACAAVAALIGLAILLFGGPGAPSQGFPAIQEVQAFAPPIAEYCRARSYGMKLDQLEELQVSEDGERATAICVMKDAEGTYGLGVRWKFSLSRKEQGGWVVEGHEGL